MASAWAQSSKSRPPSRFPGSSPARTPERREHPTLRIIAISFFTLAVLLPGLVLNSTLGW
ncbi:hypothetical protein [Pseudarthrobacter sp. Y6]|uniref:hypothetical protein n=1 Tax=Pseudarthrobacter sp. Y6 TaxID=3418422 RepID=UPI003CFA72D9